MMPVQPKIQEATDSDLEAVLNLYAQPEFDDGKVLPRDQAQLILRRIRSYPSYRIYIATHSGNVVGTFALMIMDNLGHLGATSAIVEDVAVSPSSQGQGVGKAMMQHAMELARAAGCYKLVVSSGKNRADAHEFYKSLGWEQHGISFKVSLRDD